MTIVYFSYKKRTQTLSITQKNQVIDNKKLNIGLRTIELVQEKDKIGKSPYPLKVSGEPNSGQV